MNLRQIAYIIFIAALADWTSVGYASAADIKPRGTTASLQAFIKAHAHQAPAGTRPGVVGVPVVRHTAMGHLPTLQPVLVAPHIPAGYGPNPAATQRAGVVGGPHPASSVIGGPPSKTTASKAARIDGTAMRHRF
jgi:hypothetical protein